MKNKPYEVTASDQNVFSHSAKRLVSHVMTATLIDIEPSLSFGIGGKNIKEHLGNPYGILPFAMTASREELIEAAEALSRAKYELANKGQYWKSYVYGKRQALLQGILTGMTTFNIKTL